MFEVLSDPLWLALHAAQMAGRGLDQLQLGACRSELGDGLLQVGVGHLVGVQLGAVAGQIEHLDVLLVGRQPGLDRLGVVHAPVVQDEEDLLLGAAQEPSQNVVQDVGVERAGENLPPRLAVVGAGGESGLAVPGGAGVWWGGPGGGWLSRSDRKRWGCDYQRLPSLLRDCSSA